METSMLGAAAVVWAVLLVLVVVTLYAGVKAVPQGQVWTVERFGAFTRLLQPGLNFVLPFVDRVGRRLNVQEQVVEIPEQSVITRDNATVAVDGVIYYRVMEPEKAAYQVTQFDCEKQTQYTIYVRSYLGAGLTGEARKDTPMLKLTSFISPISPDFAHIRAVCLPVYDTLHKRTYALTVPE